MASGNRNMDGFDPAQRKVLSLLAKALFGVQIPCGDAPQGEVVREAIMQGVFLLSAGAADPDLIKDEALRRAVRYLIKNSVSRNMHVANGHAQIIALLESGGIPHVIIKGLASSEWYPEQDMRLLGDVDFYVAPADVERAEALMLQNGFRAEKLSHTVHHVFIKDNCRYELHFGIPGIPEGEAGEKCRGYFSDLLEKSGRRETYFGPMRLPSPFHHGLIIILHTAHHLTNSGAGLRQLCDWAVFAAGLSGDRELSERFFAALKDIGLLKFAKCLNGISVGYLGCPRGYLPVENNEDLCAELLKDLMDGGNFGQNDIKRSREAYLITSGHGGGSKAKRLLCTLTEMVNQKWPLTRRVKPLVPVGLAYYGAVYFVRAAAGRKPKLKAMKTLRGAEARSSLYDQLELFKISE